MDLSILKILETPKMLSEIWMENECAAKKLTSSTLKDQGIRPAIVVILVVPLFETPEDLTKEVVHVTDVDDLIVATDDHTTLEVREEVEPHQEDIHHHEEHTLLKFQIFPQDADGKI